ncbi:YhgE/Pip domain-containing protein [Micrococcus lylae]|uniref:YhgE/Pip domain-containing protein n=1 Tax=Micrococcus lylae TaxID=1273 RepID=UPI000C7FFFC2|nr:YhgE/Pip domain-containing protein [Micrococcus lylae]WIK81719.1 YhgE/Pip domain-containing protein [Micrococcus lylae]
MLFRYELRRFRRGLPLLALIFVVLVPALYGALYLSANWDPYGKLDRLPVAIVNEDKPVKHEDTTLTTGADMTEKLVEDNDFDWHETTREDAEEGLRDGRYYLILEIPSDLSSNLISPDGGGTPQQAEITLRRDDANGFVIGSVTASSEAKVEAAVNRSAIEAYFEAVFDNLNELRGGMSEAADGAAELKEGTTSARQGAAQLDEGLADAKDGSSQLVSGAGELATGAGELADGADQASAGAVQLSDGVSQAQDGATQLSSGLGEAREGSQKLASGAGELAEKAPTLRSGAQDLSDGLGQLQTGSAELADGASQVADGTQKLHDTVVPRLNTVIERQEAVAADVAAVDEGVQRVGAASGKGEEGASARIAEAQAALAELGEEDPDLAESEQYAALQKALVGADERVTEVNDRVQEVAGLSAAADERVQTLVGENAAAQAKKDLTDLNNGAHAVADGAQTLQGGIGEAKTGADTLADGAGRFADGLEQLGAGATELDQGLGALQDGAGSLQSGLGELKDGADELVEGNASLADGAHQLEDGATQLQSGATELDSGIGELKDGSSSLRSGLNELEDGAGQLATELKDGVEQIPALTEAERDEASLVMSRPVKANMDVEHSAEVYGRGMAPMFFSIALWVFGIAAFNIMRPVSARLLAGRRYPLALTLAAWLPVGLVAMAGSLVMLGATVPLGLEPVHPVRAVALTLLVAATFSLIAHLIQNALGTPGSAVLLVLLILQLASTGGTYPSAVLPGFFQALHPFMPMTYSIEAFRVAISGGSDQHFWTAWTVLLVIGAAALALDMLVVHRRRRFRMKDLHPVLQH